MHILATTANNADMYEALSTKINKILLAPCNTLFVIVIPIPVKAYKNNLQPLTLSRTN